MLSSKPRKTVRTYGKKSHRTLYQNFGPTQTSSDTKVSSKGPNNGDLDDIFRNANETNRTMLFPRPNTNYIPELDELWNNGLDGANLLDDLEPIRQFPKKSTRKKPLKSKKALSKAANLIKTKADQVDEAESRAIKKLPTVSPSDIGKRDPLDGNSTIKSLVNEEKPLVKQEFIYRTPQKNLSRSDAREEVSQSIFSDAIPGSVFTHDSDFLISSTPLIKDNGESRPIYDNFIKKSTGITSKKLPKHKAENLHKASFWDYFEFKTPKAKKFPIVSMIGKFMSPKYTPIIKSSQQDMFSGSESNSPASTPSSNKSQEQIDLSEKIKSLSIDGTFDWISNVNPRNALLSHLLGICDLESSVDFHQFLSKRPSSIDTIKKVGEATFSEVYTAEFSIENLNQLFPSFKQTNGLNLDEKSLVNVALKIIPFGDNEDVLMNGEPQTKVNDIYQEVAVTRAMNSVAGANFVKCFGAIVVHGKFPEILIRHWDTWAANNESENDRPDYFGESQLYCVLVLENGGTDLEKIPVQTPRQALSIVRQLSASLAMAEKNCYFEHRDLHWGNVMIQKEKPDTIIDYRVPGLESKLNVESHGLRCVVIDYTFSRLQVNGISIYRPYDEESYFEGEGDYQFDLYRLMREEVVGASNKTAFQDSHKWQQFRPRTNILWLHYIISKLLDFKGIKRPNLKAKKYWTKQDLQCRSQVLALEERVLTYQSAYDLITQDPVFQ